MSPGMAFIVLRRSRNTRSYALVERYRDERGRVRSRVLCYLGREQDGTDTLAKAQAHWEKIQRRAKVELKTAKGERRQVLRRRLLAIEARVAVIAKHQHQLAAAAEKRRQYEQHIEEAAHWKAFETLRRQPTAEHAQRAKQAFLYLAKRCHPDQGGSHEAFIRLKRAYEAAQSAYRYATAV